MEQIVRSGEEWLRLRISQNKDGIELFVKTHPMVEDYFKTLSQERSDVIESVGGGMWFSPTGVPLRVYHVQRGHIPNQNYSFEYAGYGFYGEDIGIDRETGINLAFLRLVGISEGVNLGIRTVMSLPARRDVKEMISTNFKRFIREHLTPVRIELVITAKEF